MIEFVYQNQDLLLCLCITIAATCAALALIDAAAWLKEGIEDAEK